MEKRGDIFQMKTRHATRATLYDSIINLLIVKMKKKRKKKNSCFSVIADNLRHDENTQMMMLSVCKVD